VKSRSLPDKTYLVLTELGGVGGIQAYNRALVQTLQNSLEGSQPEVEVFSLNDAPSPEVHGFSGNKVAFLKALASVAFSERPQTVVLGHVHLAPLAGMFRLLGASRIVVIAHGFEIDCRLGPSIRLGLRAATNIVGVSENTRRILIERQHIPHGKTSVLHYAFSPPETYGVQESGPGTIRLLSVSRLVRAEGYKGIDLTLRALANLKHPDLLYNIVGDGDDRPRLEAMAYALGIADRVRFLGAVPQTEIGQHFSQCDIFVLPSTGEGLGIVYLEAMSREKPVVGVNAGGVADVIVHEFNGLLAAKADAVELARLIAQLADDIRLRQRLGKNGRYVTTPQFSESNQRRALLRLLWPSDTAEAERANVTLEKAAA
jgi:phosphatidylinositol alpha-1,6-mannosyltransferase